jgi:hypothetical protein
MPLTNNPLPNLPSQFVLPIDANLEFASAQTIAATGYVNNLNPVLDLGGGRFDGVCALLISNLKVSVTDETYKFALIGSNDIAFGNGNCDLLAFHDFAGLAANRVLATVLAASPTVPPTSRSASLIAMPFTNYVQDFIYRYAKLSLTVGGTSPTTTLAAWITPKKLM